MHGRAQPGGSFAGESNGESYPIVDERAAYFAALWACHAPEELTIAVLQNTALWDHNLNRLPGFAECVAYYLNQLINEGASATLTAFFARMTAAVNF